MGNIINPILKGFRPDPSICKVGDDYYIATSTFEWFPGVEIWHSKDLVKWDLVSRALTRKSQLNMRGHLSSGGIWAPCLTHDGEKFHLIYTDVKSWKGSRPGMWFMDADNYLVTTEDILGEWSEPIYLNSSGFDPSMFHHNGKKYLINLKWNKRKHGELFAGTIIQEYDPVSKKLIGEIRNISKGTNLPYSEGAHLYYRNGYYYLMLAEGGTGYEHAVSLLRSKDLFGDYIACPHNPILTSVNDKDLYLTRSGHGSMVEDEKGNVWLAHLSGRSVGQWGNSILGRETSLQKFYWGEDGWLYNHNGTNKPSVSIKVDNNKQPMERFVSKVYDFSKPLDIDFQTLRSPITENWCWQKGSSLFLRGRDSFASPYDQSLISKRFEHFNFDVSTTLNNYNPVDYQTAAGLSLRYEENNQILLVVTRDCEGDRKVITLFQVIDGVYDEPIKDIVIGESVNEIQLKAEVSPFKTRFAYKLDGGDWLHIDYDFDTRLLSDETSKPMGFTGSFCGMFAMDIESKKTICEFKDFKYIVKEDEHVKNELWKK